jgi:hypothetical protein
MEKGWVLAYTTRQSFQAEILKQVLHDHGINAQIINKMDRTYQTFGEIEVYVPDTHILKAKMLVKEFESN